MLFMMKQKQAVVHRQAGTDERPKHVSRIVSKAQMWVRGEENVQLQSKDKASDSC